MSTVDATELAELVGVHGLRIKRDSAQMFLHWWLATGLVRDPLPGSYRLTEIRRRLAGGLLEVDREEVAA